MFANTPEIRFKGFTGPWEQRKLSELATFSKGQGYSKSDLRGTGTPIILYGRLYIKYETVISEVDTFVQANGNSVYSRGGEVIVPASGETAEDIARASVVEKAGILLGGDLNVLQPDPIIAPVFLALTISSGEQQKELSKRAQGKSVVHLHNSDLQEVKISYPNLEEQIRIGAMFQDFDNLVALHQCKCEILQKIKKSMLEKMFPKNSLRFPEIRFKGFTAPWEQRKFGDLYQLVTQKNDLTYGIDRNITVATMRFKSDIRVTEEAYLRTYNVFLVGDIAFEGHQSKEFRYGRFVENDIGNGIVSHIFAVFRPKVDYDLMFWKYAINNERLMQPVLSRCTKASTMMNDLVASDFLSESFLVPRVEEQAMIGSFIKQLDNLITLHQRKCDTLKQMKQALLQKMFV
ncbi:MAG: restriction endonuclease subunit S [Sphaerochaetaceae bacterium]